MQLLQRRVELRQLPEPLLGGGLALGEALILLAQVRDGATQRDLALVAAVLFGPPQLHLFFAPPQAEHATLTTLGARAQRAIYSALGPWRNFRGRVCQLVLGSKWRQ